MAQTMEGTERLTAALRGLSDQVEQKVLWQSAIAGARVVRDQVKQFAPVAQLIHKRKGKLVAPGTLRRAVVLKRAPEKSTKTAKTYIVTLRRGKREQKQNRDAYYWIWVEKGHRVVGRSGRVIGQAPPYPFFVPAYRASAGRALQAMKTTMETDMSLIIRGMPHGTA